MKRIDFCGDGDLQVGQNGLQIYERTRVPEGFEKLYVVSFQPDD